MCITNFHYTAYWIQWKTFIHSTDSEYHLYPGPVSLDINNTMSNKISFQYVYKLEIINQDPKAYKN